MIGCFPVRKRSEQEELSFNLQQNQVGVAIRSVGALKGKRRER